MQHNLSRVLTGEVSAHAKVNLALEVVGRRADGYHLLRMLNVTVSLADRLCITLSESGPDELAVYDQTSGFAVLDGGPASNLALQAAVMFREEFALSYSVKLELAKHIPVGSGLGGGSADAAAVLSWLSGFFQSHLAARCPIDELDHKLRRLALRLGADVPYLLRGGPAIVSGIGEVVEPVQALSLVGSEIFLVRPPLSIPTPRIFSALRAVDEELLKTLGAGTFVAGEVLTYRNDLERFAFQEFPELEYFYNDLRKGMSASVVRMTGSGSAFYLLPETGRSLLRSDCRRALDVTASYSGWSSGVLQICKANQ